jgi:hypothetical protein
LSLQYNKRDLPRLIPEAELDATLNDRAVKAISAIASRGEGVLETLRYITVSVFNSIKSTTGVQQQPKQPSAPQGMTPIAPPTTGRPQSVPEVRGPASSPMASPPSMSGLSPPMAAAGGPRSRSSALESALQAAKTAGRAALETGGSTAGVAQFPSFQAPGTPRVPPPNAPSANGSGYDPAKIGPEVWYEEFKNLALTYSQLTERLSAVEAELKRLGRENQEIREYLSRQRP